MMGGNSGGCRGESYRPRQIGEKWEMVTGEQKEGKRNRIKVIGDVRGRKKKRNSATNIPSEPASVTNAVQGGRGEARGMKGSALRMTLVAHKTRVRAVTSSPANQP